MWHKLSDEIDANFVKLFDGFTAPINHILASKDHGSNLDKSLLGFISKKDGSKMEVIIKGAQIVPKQPNYDYIPEENLVKIYGSKKTLKGYQQYVLKSLNIKGVDIGSLKIELIDNINYADELNIPFSHGVKDFNNKFMLGFSKIVAGFATSKGIKREDLPCTIDTDAEKIKWGNNIVPFYPSGILDSIIEPFRSVLEENFPTHTLLLYTDNGTDKTRLVCYIDLFSTFQYHVILNFDYKGPPISESYYQTIIKQKKPEIDVRRIRYKRLPIFAESIGVEWKLVRKSNTDEIYEQLEQKYKQFQLSYVIDLGEYVRSISSKAILKLITAKAGLHQDLDDIEKQIIDMIPEPDTDDYLSLKLETDRIQNQNPKIFYKQNFIRSVDHKSELYSTLNDLIDKNNHNIESTRTYTTTKFLLLSHFVQINSKKNKTT